MKLFSSLSRKSELLKNEIPKNAKFGVCGTLGGSA